MVIIQIKMTGIRCQTVQLTEDRHHVITGIFALIAHCGRRDSDPLGTFCNLS